MRRVSDIIRLNREVIQRITQGAARIKAKNTKTGPAIAENSVVNHGDQLNQD